MSGPLEQTADAPDALDGGRMLIGAAKIAFGVISLFSAGLVLLIKEPSVHGSLERVVTGDRHVSKAYADLVQQLLNEAQAHSVSLSALLFLGGLAQIAAAILFLKRHPAGWWVLLAAVVAFLPVEAVQMIAGRDVGAGVGLGVDLAILGALLVRRSRLQTSRS